MVAPRRTAAFLRGPRRALSARFSMRTRVCRQAAAGGPSLGPDPDSGEFPGVSPSASFARVALSALRVLRAPRPA
eukprot:3484428-Lingulodinium_polyedra.AAC.1